MPKMASLEKTCPFGRAKAGLSSLMAWPYENKEEKRERDRA